MNISGDGDWYDLFIIVFVFAIILVKLFIFFWYRSRKDKKYNQ